MELRQELQLTRLPYNAESTLFDSPQRSQAILICIPLSFIQSYHLRCGEIVFHDFMNY